MSGVASPRMSPNSGRHPPRCRTAGIVAAPSDRILLPVCSLASRTLREAPEALWLHGMDSCNADAGHLLTIDQIEGSSIDTRTLAGESIRDARIDVWGM